MNHPPGTGRVMSGLLARLRSLWHGIRRRPDVEAEMLEEFQHHMELRAADLMRSGMSQRDAARTARLEFGSQEQHLHHGRRSRGLQHVDRIRFSLLDLKLGLRMLGRYPGLTLVGGLAMAFAIWMGGTAFEFIDQVVSPRLPLRDGARVIAIDFWERETSQRESRVAYEFTRIAPTLRTIEAMGAYRERRIALQVGNAFGESVDVADITPSAFDLALAGPVLGRPLAAGDDVPGSPAVIVIGYETWQGRFGGDSSVVGRVVRVDGVNTTVVGVMPEGFGFPNVQQAWLPLRLGTVAEPGAGPPISLFGRLIGSATRREAESEVTSAVASMTRAGPRGQVQLRARVIPFSRAVLDVDLTSLLAIRALNVLLILLVVLVCGNVALLMFARAATRENEIVVRTALGAGRGRIVGQFFAEALVLGTIAAVLGLAAARTGLRLWIDVFEQAEGPLPFWVTPRLSPITYVYTALLALVGAAVAGILPAVKVTRGLGQRLRETAAATGGPRLGGVWTTVIVAQVAVTVVLPVVLYYTQRELSKVQSLDVGFNDREFLTARLVYDQVGAASDTSAAAAEQRRTKFTASQRRLMSLLGTEPTVAGVTFGERMPRMYHPYRLIEVDEGGAAPLHPQWPGYRISSIKVDRGFFDVMGVPVAGRTFRPGETHVAIVNESFVRVVLGGRQPIGRRLRYTYFENDPAPEPGTPPGPWFEIIGVVRDMGFAVESTADPKYAGAYHPADLGEIHPVSLAIHVQGGDPAAFGNRLRELADRVDPLLGIDRPVVIADLAARNIQFMRFTLRLLGVVSTIALVLSLAGIYAVMSFTVARRTREIGLRLALGARRLPLVLAILGRPLRQVATGIVVGATFLLISVMVNNEAMFTVAWVLELCLYALGMLGVCLLACAWPMRRALSVQPTEALKADS